MDKKKSLRKTMRIYHRYLGFFLAGIMSIYALSGIIMIFRTTDFLKQEIQKEKIIQPNVSKEDLGNQLSIRNLKVINEDDNRITFPEGTYNKMTGNANYTVKELPVVLQSMEKLHKATTNSPIYFLNIFFGISLLFFSVSAFFMFAKSAKIFKKGIYVAVSGVIFTVVIILL